tara:strand:+ start:673 stop:975 length:303 start_codon:yes stop_codon:yes gene_type:complete
VYNISRKTELFIQPLYSEIEYIRIRSTIISKKYNQLLDRNLKRRFLKEFNYLQSRLKQIENKINIIDLYKYDKFSLHKLLAEKCKRIKKNMDKVNYLFSF